MVHKLIFSLFFLLWAANSFATDVIIPKADMHPDKVYYYKKLDEAVLWNAHRDTGYKRVIVLNDSTLRLNVNKPGIYLITHIRIKYFVYIHNNDQKIDLTNRNRDAVSQLQDWVVYRANITSLEAKSVWHELRLLPAIDTNYYKSYLTDVLLKSILNRIEADSNLARNISLTSVDTVFATLGSFEYRPNLFSLSPLYGASSLSKDVLNAIKKSRPDDINRLLTLNEHYGGKYNLSSDSISKMNKELNGIATRNPYLRKIHPYLVDMPDRIDQIVVQDSSLARVDLGGKLEGKYTILYFWGTWCGPCIKIAKEVLPEVKKAIDKHPNLQLYTVAAEGAETISDWQEDIHDGKAGYNNLIALGGFSKGWSGTAMAPVCQELLIDMVPNFVLIGPDKKILLRNDINGKVLLQMLDGLAGAK